MRFDATGDRVAYTLGYGEPPASRRLRVVVASHAGTPLAELPAGHDPHWTGLAALVARHPAGGEDRDTVAGFTLRRLGANDGDLSAAGAFVAYAPTRASGVHVIGADGLHVGLWPHTFEPAISAGGSLAVRDAASGILRLVRVPGCVDVVAREPILGPGTRARWAGQAVAWDTLPYGRVFGRVTPGAPTVELTIPGRACSRPVLVWAAGRLYVGLVADAGTLVLAAWSALEARDGRGWRIGASDNSAFAWDLIADAAGRGVRVAYLTPGGTLATARVDTDAALEALEAPPPIPPTRPPTPPPPTPHPPPDPDPPDPRPADPEDPMPSARSIPRDQTVAAAIAIDQYLVGNPRLGLPDGLLPSDAGTVPLDLALDATCAYLIGEWIGFVLEQGAQLPGDGPGWEDLRRRGLEHTFRKIEAERGGGGAAVTAGPVRGPLGVVGRDFTVPDA